jgi:hypothetical protein
VDDDRRAIRLSVRRKIDALLLYATPHQMRAARDILATADRPNVKLMSALWQLLDPPLKTDGVPRRRQPRAAGKG